MPAATRTRAPRLPAAVRRQQILDAALAITGRDGVVGVSMESVAREVGVAKTVVYEAFPDRAALITGLLDREHGNAMEELVSMIPSSSADTEPDSLLLEALDSFLGALQANPERWRLLLSPFHGTPIAVQRQFERVRSRLLEVLVPLIEWGIAARGGPHIDATLAAETCIAAAENLARLYLADPREYPPERLREFAAALLASVAPA